jgi:hypothetical protein
MGVNAGTFVPIRWTPLLEAVDLDGIACGSFGLHSRVATQAAYILVQILCRWFDVDRGGGRVIPLSKIASLMR